MTIVKIYSNLNDFVVKLVMNLAAADGEGSCCQEGRITAGCN